MLAGRSSPFNWRKLTVQFFWFGPRSIPGFFFGSSRTNSVKLLREADGGKRCFPQKFSPLWAPDCFLLNRAQLIVVWPPPAHRPIQLSQQSQIIDGFGSYVSDFMKCAVFRGIGGTAYKCRLLWRFIMQGQGTEHGDQITCFSNITYRHRSLHIPQVWKFRNIGTRPNVE